MDEHLEVGACPFPRRGKLESWKVWKTRPCCCNPDAQSSPDLQQRKTRIQMRPPLKKLLFCARLEDYWHPQTQHLFLSPSSYCICLTGPHVFRPEKKKMGTKYGCIFMLYFLVIFCGISCSLLLPLQMISPPHTLKPNEEVLVWVKIRVIVTAPFQRPSND